MAREQLVARLALVKRLMVRVNLHVLRRILVTDFTNEQLRAQLIQFREAVHGPHASRTRAEYEDRLAAILLKECEGRRGLGYDHGMRFMSVEEELEEKTDSELREELQRRGFKAIPRKKQDKYDALCELLEGEHEADLEDSIDEVMCAELERRGLPTTKKAISAWVQRNRARVMKAVKAATLKAAASVERAASPVQAVQRGGGDGRGGRGGQQKRSGRKRRRGNDDGAAAAEESNATPRKKRRRVAVVSSPSAEDQGNSSHRRDGGSSASSDSEDVLAADPLAIPTLVEKPNWKKITLRQMELELLVPHFDNETLVFAAEDVAGENGGNSWSTCTVM